MTHMMSIAARIGSPNPVVRLRRLIVTGTMLLSLGACLSGRGPTTANDNLQEPKSKSKATVATAKKMGPPASAAQKPLATTAIMMQPDLAQQKATPKAPTPPEVNQQPVVTKPPQATTHMYVTSEFLNVRAEPAKTATIVGRFARGSMVSVASNGDGGDWAKVAEGQYVWAKHLSAHETSQIPAKKGVKTRSLAKTK